MSTTTPITAHGRMASPERFRMSPVRKAALIAGIAYIATFIFSIPVKFGLWTDVLDNPDFILGAGSDAGVPMGALFEALTALTGVVTAVALYSVAKQYSRRAALGFVTTRVMEAGLIFVGILSILSMLTLRQDVAGTPGADPDSLATVGRALLAVHDWAFLFGPGLMASLNALLIGSVMYRSRLLPRWIPTLGLVGAPLLLVSNIAVLFGLWTQISGPAMVLVLPIAIWEFSFGVHMTTKGFRHTPVDEASFAPVNSAIFDGEV